MSVTQALTHQERARRIRKEIREWRRALRLQHERMLSQHEGSNWPIDFKFYLVALRIIEDVATQAKKDLDPQNVIRAALTKFAAALPAYKQMRDVLVVHIGAYIVGHGKLQQTGAMVGDPWGSYDRLHKGGTVYSHAGELAIPEATAAAEELCDTVLQVVDRISPPA